MRLLSKYKPYTWVNDEETQKYIIKQELIDNFETPEIAKIVMAFFKTKLNSWNTVKYIKEEDEYIIFSYNKNLIELDNIVVVTKHLNKLKKCLDDIYKSSLKTEFMFNGELHYILPIDNWMDNYMYDINKEKFVMIDVDSFSVFNKAELDELYKINFGNVGTLNLKNYK